MTRLRTTSFRLTLALAAVALLAAPARAQEASVTGEASAPTEAAPPTSTEQTPSQTDTVSGVKLGVSGARQQVHVLISRRERAEGKHELSLLGTVQVNGKFTQHAGVGLEYGYHLREAFALTGGGTWFAQAANNSFSETELLEKIQLQSNSGSLLLLNWEAHAGVELSPIYGKFAFFNYGVVQFGFYLGTSLGVGGTSLQLTGDSGAGGRTFGSTGLKPVAVVNAGFRMFFSERIAVRAEIRDTVFSGSVDSIAGCTVDDLEKGDDKKGIECSGGTIAPDAPFNSALAILRQPSSDVLNNVAFTAALSVLF
jgi:outer membrane beta-barrel protein